MGEPSLKVVAPERAHDRLELCGVQPVSGALLGLPVRAYCRPKLSAGNPPPAVKGY
jgi:hypothetical protein